MDACTSSPTHMLAGVVAVERPPEPPFPVSASDAFALSAWYLAYALDRLDADPRCEHPAVRAHGIAARTQHDAIGKVIASG